MLLITIFATNFKCCCFFSVKFDVIYELAALLIYLWIFLEYFEESKFLKIIIFGKCSADYFIDVYTSKKELSLSKIFPLSKILFVICNGIKNSDFASNYHSNNKVICLIVFHNQISVGAIINLNLIYNFLGKKIPFSIVFG